VHSQFFRDRQWSAYSIVGSRVAGIPTLPGTIAAGQTAANTTHDYFKHRQSMPRSAATVGPCVALHDQLPCLQLRPHSGSHFIPIDIFIFGAAGSRRCGF
jgi:hypothetical protein